MARQRLGQHFLRDQSVIDAMLGAIRSASGRMAEADGNQLMVEVGPGRGVLTEALLQKGFTVVAIEWDQALAEQLSTRFRGNPNLHVVQADIRHFDLVSFLKTIQPNPRYSVVANLPYYLSSYFLRQIFAVNVLPERMALLLQKEVAERIVAAPGQNARSALTILVELHAEARLVRAVSREAFSPPPKVESAVVAFDHIHQTFAEREEEKQFFRLVKAGFGEKRKVLFNSLAGGLQLEKEAVERMLQTSHVSPTARPSDLALAQWLTLFREWQKEL